MTMPPAISVVIPLYNKRQYIARCLDSVRAQTFGNYQLIVVDDGSTDDGAAIAQGYLRAGDALLRQTNAGVSAARNRGMAAAAADLVALLDADDEWTPEHLAHLAHLARAFPQAGIFGTGSVTRSGRWSIETTIKSSRPGCVSYFNNSSIESILHSSSVALRKQAIADTSGFAQGVRFGEDVDFFCRACLRWPLAYHPAITSVYHRDPANSAAVSHAATPHELLTENLIAALEEQQVAPELRREVEDFLRRVIVGQVVHDLCAGNRDGALRRLSKGLPGYGPGSAFRRWKPLAKWVPPGLWRTWQRMKLLRRMLMPQVEHERISRIRLHGTPRCSSRHQI